MGGCDEIDVMRALFLQFQKNLGKTGYRYLPAGKSMGNFMILTVDTAQITPAEKDCARSVRAGKAGFLPEMESGSCCRENGGLPAITGFSGVSVDMAFSRAERTV